MYKYQVTFSMVFSEQDNFEKGCFGDSCMKHLDDAIIIQSTTLDGLIKEMCSKFNVSRDNILLNSCDEIGRVDVQTMTRSAGQVKDSYQNYKDKFVNGELDLWLNCFIGECSTIPQVIDFSEIQI